MLMPMVAMALVRTSSRVRSAAKAMIAAAKSDGHLDARERELLHGEMARLNADVETRAWFDAELAKPVEPADVAAGVTSPQMSAEVYLASLIVVVISPGRLGSSNLSVYRNSSLGTSSRNAPPKAWDRPVAKFVKDIR
jgi:hypothetical protein